MFVLYIYTVPFFLMNESSNWLSFPFLYILLLRRTMFVELGFHGRLAISQFLERLRVFRRFKKSKTFPHFLGWSATSPQTWEHFLLSRRGNNSLTSRIETRHSRLKKNPTNHGGASCFIRRPETSRPHRLMKTSSVQSKRHESHYKWPHRETNDYYSCELLRV